ncbi:TetR/AcrR family transcriptional regulator [Streptomyces bambusae]|uniref:TetR family transcriptional regulator n=1 Tax=Streptomyces bambusae TaxID=1550616 RepID=A0ABS6Z874_9ACTN|nr:TetR/AcrR family transcriptional regulator [Streptomyces bambusae]MBW5483930.1 TetR family transcriptional regulator [Streptomyces bambusae]
MSPQPGESSPGESRPGDRRPGDPRSGDPRSGDPRSGDPRLADPRTVRTRTRLHEALLAACAEQPLRDLTVAELVRRAGIARATFYLHYTDVQDLAVDTCAGIVRDAVDALHAWRGVPDPAAPPPALTAFFTTAHGHAGLYRALMHPGGGGPLGDTLHRELRERSRTERAAAGAPAPELIASAVAATFTGVLADWAHGLIDSPPQDLAADVWRLLIVLHRYGAGAAARDPGDRPGQRT